MHHCRVEIAAASGHAQALERGQPHGGVDGSTVADGGNAATGTCVRFCRNMQIRTLDGGMHNRLA